MWLYLSGLITGALHSRWPGTVTGRTEGRWSATPCVSTVVEPQAACPGCEGRAQPDTNADCEDPLVLEAHRSHAGTGDGQRCVSATLHEALDWMSCTVSNPVSRWGVTRTINLFLQEKVLPSPTHTPWVFPRYHPLLKLHRSFQGISRKSVSLAQDHFSLPGEVARFLSDPGFFLPVSLNVNVCMHGHKHGFSLNFFNACQERNGL